MERKKYEEYAYVLDYLAHGKPGAKSAYRAMPVVQLIGETYFTLLESVAKKGEPLVPHERIYVGKEFLRKKISHITGRISYEELSSTGRMELSSVIEEIVKKQEKRFVEFFNTVQPLTPRMHALELLPGIGKKYLWAIISAREKKPFTSFEDLQKRTGIPDPIKIISKRILEEISTGQKYYLFTRPH